MFSGPTHVIAVLSERLHGETKDDLFDDRLPFAFAERRDHGFLVDDTVDEVSMSAYDTDTVRECAHDSFLQSLQSLTPKA